MPNARCFKRLFGEELEAVRQILYEKYPSILHSIVRGPTPTERAKWKTKEGKYIYIADMKNQHLMNAIYRLVSKYKQPNAISSTMAFETIRRGLIAVTIFDVMRLKNDDGLQELVYEKIVEDNANAVI